MQRSKSVRKGTRLDAVSLEGNLSASLATLLIPTLGKSPSLTGSSGVRRR
jgi:hypothetical protein